MPGLIEINERKQIIHVPKQTEIYQRQNVVEWEIDKCGAARQKFRFVLDLQTSALFVSLILPFYLTSMGHYAFLLNLVNGFSPCVLLINNAV